MNNFSIGKYNSLSILFHLSDISRIVYLTFLMRIDLSLRARSCDFNLRSKFFLAKTRFSEFLIWWVCSFLIKRSTPLDVICFCINVSALSRLFWNTLTRMPRHWFSCELSEFNSVDGRLNTVDDTRLAIEFISRVFENVWIEGLAKTMVKFELGKLTGLCVMILMGLFFFCPVQYCDARLAIWL